MGYTLPPADGLDALRRELRELARQVAELQRPDGSQLSNSVEKLSDLINGLLEQTDINSAGNGTIGGNLVVGGTGRFTSTLYSVGSSATDLSVLAGSRQNAWQLYTGANVGLYGYAPSSFRRKTHWQPVPYSAEAFLACTAYLYEYRGQVAIRDDPSHPNYDPNYEVPTEVGFMAELLIKHGLGQFVTMLDDTPIGIDYAAFAAVGMVVVGRAHRQEIDNLSARLDAAGL